MTFALILAVSSVWGIVFYQVFSASGSEDNYPIKKPVLKTTFENLDDYSYRDTSALNLSYPDPFLRGVLKETPAEVKSVSEGNPLTMAPARQIPQKPIINWDIIKYTGYVLNSEGKKTASILTISGKEYMLPEGGAIDGVKLVKSFKDSVKVLYQQNTRFIKLQI